MPRPRTIRRCSAGGRRGAASTRSTAPATRSSASTTPTSSCCRSRATVATRAGPASSRASSTRTAKACTRSLSARTTSTRPRARCATDGLEVIDPADGDGIDVDTGARRQWRSAQVPLKSSNGARIFFIEHRSPADALPVAPVAADDGAYVQRMDHAVVLSADMEASRRLWGDVLDARLALDRTFPERNTRILFFRLRDITIEISGGAQQSEEGIGKPDRMWGMAWGVGNLEATCARLRAAGIETSGPRRGIKPGTLVATVKGAQAHGVATLLIEHTPESFKPESRVAARCRVRQHAADRRAFTARSLDHVVVSTTDLDATAAKWASTLDLHAAESRPARRRPVPRREAAGRQRVRRAVQPLADDHRIAKTIAERGQGMYSISVEVDSLDAAVADLRAKGVPGVRPRAGHLDRHARRPHQQVRRQRRLDPAHRARVGRPNPPSRSETPGTGPRPSRTPRRSTPASA